MYACGDGTTGLLGTGDTKTHNVPTPVVRPEGAAPVVDVALGWGHAVLLDANGVLWACGANTKGQLGFGTARGKYLQPSAVPVKHVEGEEDAGVPAPDTATVDDEEPGAAVQGQGRPHREGGVVQIHPPSRPVPNTMYAMYNGRIEGAWRAHRGRIEGA